MFNVNLKDRALWNHLSLGEILVNPRYSIVTTRCYQTFMEVSMTILTTGSTGPTVLPYA